MQEHSEDTTDWFAHHKEYAPLLVISVGGGLILLAYQQNHNIWAAGFMTVIVMVAILATPWLLEKVDQRGDTNSIDDGDEPDPPSYYQ